MAMTEEDYKVKIEELKKRAELIPSIVDDKMKEMNEFGRIYKEKEAERIKAQKLFNDAQKQRNKALRDKQKLTREVRELNRELNDEIPRKISYYERKVKQLKKQQEQTPAPPKDKLDEVIEGLKKKRFDKNA